jgi:hypothetical protein
MKVRIPQQAFVVSAHLPLKYAEFSAVPGAAETFEAQRDFSVGHRFDA